MPKTHQIERSIPAPAGDLNPPLAISVSRMQAIDSTAIDHIGIPRILLMDHAGLAVAKHAGEFLSSKKGGIVIVCGNGFNGGDGLSTARHLNDKGINVRVLLAGSRTRLREDVALFAGILDKLKIPIEEWDDKKDPRRLDRWFSDCSLIIDALLGVGIKKNVREPIATIIDRINKARKSVVSIDIPSGLNADTGEPLGKAVNATMTVTFGSPKIGCTKGKGVKLTGKLIVEPITIPRYLLKGSK